MRAVQQYKAQFLEHRCPSYTSSKVSQQIHIESPGHHMDLEKVQILDTAPRWFERSVKDAIHIRANQPSLNKDGGRYQLPRVYDPILTSTSLKVNNTKPRQKAAEEGCSNSC